jgi:hypothetical protein
VRWSRYPPPAPRACASIAGQHRGRPSADRIPRPADPDALAAGFSRGFLAAAGIALPALLAALATTQVRRQDLAGAGLAAHEDAARQPATVRQHQDRAARAAAVRPGWHC